MLEDDILNPDLKQIPVWTVGGRSIVKAKDLKTLKSLSKGNTRTKAAYALGASVGAGTMIHETPHVSSYKIAYQKRIAELRSSRHVTIIDAGSFGRRFCNFASFGKFGRPHQIGASFTNPLPK